MTNYTMEISRPIRIGEKCKRPKLSIDLIIQPNPDFTDTDIAKMLFAIEFAANGHSELPIRVHINTKYEHTKNKTANHPTTE